MSKQNAGPAAKDLIDQHESALIKEAYARMRQEQSDHFEELCRTDAQEHLERIRQEFPWLDIAIEEGAPYRMEGETGLWSFRTYRISETTSGRVIYDTRKLFPTQRGKQRLRTAGAEELMLFFAINTKSVRESTELINRIRHQNGEAKLANSTLRDYEEKVGTEIANTVKASVTNIHNEPVEPPPDPPALLNEVAVEAAFREAEVPQELIEEARQNPVQYTNPDQTSKVSADTVFCKKQKERRSEDAPPPKKSDRKTVSTCTACVANKKDSIALVELNYFSLAWAVIAVLKVNGLNGNWCCLLSDGEKKLRSTFIPLLEGSVAGVYSVLDWYHLQKRCSELLSMAIKGKDKRNTHRDAIAHYLWYGCVQSALGYIGGISDEDIKSRAKLTELVNYLTNRQDQIPVYAVRKALGLPNGSSRAEKLNDVLVSKRQKGKGISWSQDGSFALANIRMLKKNGQVDDWLDTRSISLEFPRKTG